MNPKRNSEEKIKHSLPLITYLNILRQSSINFFYS